MKDHPVKRRVFEIISKGEKGDFASKFYDNTAMALVILSIVSIVLESFDDIAARYSPLFSAFEILCICFFSIEYILRVWTANLLYPDSRHPRLKYVTSFIAIIDLLSLLPFYLPFTSADLRFLRMIRLLRILKLGRYVESMGIIIDVIHSTSRQLAVSFIFCAFVMLFSSIVMYTVENPVQPEQFPNVIASLWWAICTLTTVGYGDVYPITVPGKIFASIISLIGIGIIAIPTGIISAGFTNAIQKRKKENTQPDPKHFCPYCGHKLDE